MELVTSNHWRGFLRVHFLEFKGTLSKSWGTISNSKKHKDILQKNLERADQLLSIHKIERKILIQKHQ